MKVIPFPNKNKCSCIPKCSCKYIYRMAEIDDGSGDWCSQIGQQNDGEIVVIATLAGFQNERESTIAAIAFIDGMQFSEGE